jgi:hypothetical protein
MQIGPARHLRAPARRLPWDALVLSSIVGLVNRDALARASRRRLALDALAFERDRAALLAEELEDLVAEVEGARVDAAAFAEMRPDEVALAVTALGRDAGLDDEEELTDELEGAEAELEDGDAGDGVEDEIARLQGELEASHRVQAALERYIALLADAPAE